MKRKLIYSVSICVLAFTLVSAIFADKPTKVQNINVPDLYDAIAKIPGGPITVNGGPEPFWHVKNNTGCAFQLDIYFGLGDIIPNPSPLSGSILRTPPVFGGTLGTEITFADLQNQYSYLTLTPPLNITHAAVRISFPGTGGAWVVDPSYATETSQTYVNPDASEGCKCVVVVWDYVNRTTILNTCP